MIKVVGKFNTEYSREKEMDLNCLLLEFVISDLLKWPVLKRWNKKPSTLEKTPLNKGILFAPRDTTKFSKTVP